MAISDLGTPPGATALPSDEAPFPPAPWRLRGPAVLVAAPVRAERVRHLAPPGVRLVAPLGWTLGGLLLARYDRGEPLQYGEVIAFSGLGVADGKPGFVVSHIAVDSPASVGGGRRIWGLPKRLATFGWSDGDPLAAATIEEDGRDVLRLRTRRAGQLPFALPLASATFGVLGGETVRAASVGRFRGGPALARLRVREGGPLDGLGLSGTWPALACDEVDVLFPAPPGGATV